METLYHGTDADFQMFQTGRITWFTPDRAETLAQYRSDYSRVWYIFSVRLTLSSPADLGDPFVQSSLERAGFHSDQVGQLTEFSVSVIPLLKSHGFDGISVWMGNARHYAVFSPEQIAIIARESVPAEV